MIHDGDYYSIVYKDNILSLLDEIYQKKKIYALKISGPGSWYSSVNGEHYQVCRIAHMRFFEGQYEDSTAVLSMGFIKCKIDDVAS